MIKEDRDPNDYHRIHEAYLKKKNLQEGIQHVNGIYQNHSIIFVNKAGI